MSCNGAADAIAPAAVAPAVFDLLNRTPTQPPGVHCTLLLL